MLKIKFTDNRQQPFWVTDNGFSIGRKQDNHLVIDHTSISPNHARIAREGGAFTLQDLSSLTGTFVNDRPITKLKLSYGDRIQLGEINLEVVDPLQDVAPQAGDYWALIADSSWLSGQEFPLPVNNGRPITMGRGKNCDLVFPSSHLSRQHAQIEKTNEGVFIRDLDSVNGTFVNDKKVTYQKIAAGDKIRIDLYSFLVFGPGIDLPDDDATVMAPTPITRGVAKKHQGGEEKLWKTRPTSPGNREEPVKETKGKRRAWTTAIGILALFAAVVIYVGINLFSGS